MNKHLAKLQKELDISDTHNMPSTDIILKNVNNKINVSPEERKIYMKKIFKNNINRRRYMRTCGYNRICG